jgi:hypothetical protein
MSWAPGCVQGWHRSVRRRQEKTEEVLRGERMLLDAMHLLPTSFAVFTG